MTEKIREKILKKVYETDASQVKGEAISVIIPRTITEIMTAVKLNSKITPRGAGTGLAGGAVPKKSVVIDLSRLNKMSNFDERRKTIEVHAGVILDELQDFLDEYGLEFPVNPSSHSVATIGGMIATDATGSRAIKYGRTSKHTEWIKIINSDGELKKITKTQLSDFAGLEGTTGIIIKAKLKLTSKKQRTADFLCFETIDEVLNLTKELKRNSDVSMLEFFGKQISEWLDLGKKYHLLVEYESNKGKLKDDEYKKILHVKDLLYPLVAKKDFSRIEDPRILSLGNVKQLILWLEQNKIPVFGHLGVGILHPCFLKEQGKLVSELMRLVKKLHGNVTGEHGIGLLKKEFLDLTEKRLCQAVKNRNDPQNKFNPGKII